MPAGNIDDLDIEAELSTQVAAVAAGGGAIEICGGGSKRFYGAAVEDYDPAELVITLRAGCRLQDVEALLASNRQMFGFEPPHFAPQATIGGMVASGLAGPRRAFSGSIRDFVLGAKLLDGNGQVLQFGGRVIKNVAGFDLSRLLAGSLGTLGIILEVSIRVIPMFLRETTLVFEHESADDHIRWINELGSKPYPISAAVWHAGSSHIRLSASEQGVEQAIVELGGDRVEFDWVGLREQSHDFFDVSVPLTCISLPPTTEDIVPKRSQLIEWGGARRWLSGEVKIDKLREKANRLAGSVCAFRGHDAGTARFQALAPAMLKLQRSIKSSFDPAGVFNHGKIYPGL